MWIFGYGSIVWKPEINYIQRLDGHVKGYIRRFWQLSEDHRGQPGSPGRVVTLISTANPSDCVYGAAYQISNEDEQSVRKALDEREKDGYTIVETIFYPNDQKQYQQMPCYTYMAQEGNTFWGGEAPIEDIARQITRAEGPSGTNREYLFKLVDAIKAITPINDEHLTQLQQLVKKIINEQENQ